MGAGLDPETSEPYVCGMDLIGCKNEPPDFAVAGTCEEQLFGMCETLWTVTPPRVGVPSSTSSRRTKSPPRISKPGWIELSKIMPTVFISLINFCLIFSYYISIARLIQVH